MKHSIAIIFLFTPLLVKPCGSGEEEHPDFFQILFDSKNRPTEQYFPFGHTIRPHASHYSEKIPGNLRLWSDILLDWKDDKINHALTTDSNVLFENLWEDKNSSIELRAKDYMVFARKCSEHFEYRSGGSWDYEEILRDMTPRVSALLDEGISKFKSETNSQLKMRFAYQVIRIFHYSKKYEEAIGFYETVIKPKNHTHNEIYYYLLDQIAGCYYSQGDYSKAAYLFLQVFMYSEDRKKSAFKSYDFCVDHAPDPIKNLNNQEEEIGLTVLNNIRSYSDGIQEMTKIAKLNPNSKYLEKIFVRALNMTEYDIWHYFDKEETYPINQNQQRLKSLQSVLDTLILNDLVVNKEFWLLGNAYISFVAKNFQETKTRLKLINAKTYENQKEILSLLCEVLSWDKIGLEQEVYLSKICNLNLGNNSWKGIVEGRVAQIYYDQEGFEKSFIIKKRLSELKSTSPLSLVDALIAFVSKDDKNAFEEILANRLNNQYGNPEPLEYLTYVKGVYLLEQNSPKKALSLLSKFPSYDKYNKGIWKPISPRIFSNNTVECFNCPEDNVMDDLVYKASPFAFIKNQFNRAELANYLITLDSITNEKNIKTWKRKLAHYLLGNYYFNISETGYYRNAIAGGSNCCDYDYFPPCDWGTTYNSFDKIEAKWNSRLNFIEKAQYHYEQTISLSTDKELNARCHYILAKCELNNFYDCNNRLYFWEDFYDGSIEGQAENYKYNFEKLKQNYSNTKFYSKIIKECSFFRYYCSL